MNLLNIQPIIPQPFWSLILWVEHNILLFVFLLVTSVCIIVFIVWGVKKFVNNLYKGLGESITEGMREQENDNLFYSHLDFTEIFNLVNDLGENNV